jgi:hypothetical protein
LTTSQSDIQSPKTKEEEEEEEGKKKGRRMNEAITFHT